MFDRNKLFAVLKYKINCLLGTWYLNIYTCHEDYQMKLLNINDFVRCSSTCKVNGINNIKMCFWKQTIYYDTCLSPKRANDIYKDCIYHLDTMWIVFFKVAILS